MLLLMITLALIYGVLIVGHFKAQQAYLPTKTQKVFQISDEAHEETQTITPEEKNITRFHTTLSPHVHSPMQVATPQEVKKFYQYNKTEIDRAENLLIQLEFRAIDKKRHRIQYFDFESKTDLTETEKKFWNYLDTFNWQLLDNDSPEAKRVKEHLQEIQNILLDENVFLKATNVEKLKNDIVLLEQQYAWKEKVLADQQAAFNVFVDTTVWHPMKVIDNKFVRAVFNDVEKADRKTLHPDLLLKTELLTELLQRRDIDYLVEINPDWTRQVHILVPRLCPPLPRNHWSSNKRYQHLYYDENKNCIAATRSGMQARETYNNVINKALRAARTRKDPVYVREKQSSVFQMPIALDNLQHRVTMGKTTTRKQG